MLRRRNYGSGGATIANIFRETSDPRICRIHGPDSSRYDQIFLQRQQSLKVSVKERGKFRSFEMDDVNIIE